MREKLLEAAMLESQVKPYEKSEPGDKVVAWDGKEAGVMRTMSFSKNTHCKWMPPNWSFFVKTDHNDLQYLLNVEKRESISTEYLLRLVQLHHLAMPICESITFKSAPLWG